MSDSNVFLVIVAIVLAIVAGTGLGSCQKENEFNYYLMTHTCEERVK